MIEGLVLKQRQNGTWKSKPMAKTVSATETNNNWSYIGSKLKCINIKPLYTTQQRVGK